MQHEVARGLAAVSHVPHAKTHEFGRRFRQKPHELAVNALAVLRERSHGIQLERRVLRNVRHEAEAVHIPNPLTGLLQHRSSVRDVRRGEQQRHTGGCGQSRAQDPAGGTDR